MTNKKQEEIKQIMLEISNQTELNINQETQQIGNVLFYKDIKFQGNELDVERLGMEDVYIVEIKNVEKEQTKREKNGEEGLGNITYLIYNEEQELIAIVDEMGKVNFTLSYLEGLKGFNKEYFRDLDLDELSFELPKEVKENDLVMTNEEMKEYAMKDKTKLKEEEEAETDEVKKEKTAEMLGIKKEEIKAISTINPRGKVTDKCNLADIIPETSEYTSISIVCTGGNNNSSSKFTVLGVKEDGSREKINSIEPIEGTSGNKDVISINEDGTEVKEKQVNGLMRINARNRNDGLAVSVGDYGMLDINYVSNIMDKENRRATPIRTKELQNQRIPTAKVRENAGDSIEEMEKEGRVFRKQEKRGVNPQSLDGIETDEYYGTTLEELKKQIKERVLKEERIEEMSGSELQNFIESEIEKEGLRLTEKELESTANEIHLEVKDELMIGRERK